MFYYYDYKYIIQVSEYFLSYFILLLKKIMYVHMRKQKSQLNRFLFASVFATFYMVKSAIKLRSPFMMIYDENST